MKKIAMVTATIGALGLGSIAAPSPAEAHWRGGWGPGIAGGLIAGAVIGGLPPRHMPGAGLRLLRLRSRLLRRRVLWRTLRLRCALPMGRRLRHDLPHSTGVLWLSGRVVRSAYAYYGGAYPVVRHRWHHHHW